MGCAVRGGAVPTGAEDLPETLGAPGTGPYLIQVFASWCAPCELEALILVALKDQGVPIIGVAYKDEPAKTQAFLARTGDPYVRVLVDRQGRAGNDLGVSGVPETYLAVPYTPPTLPTILRGSYAAAR